MHNLALAGGIADASALREAGATSRALTEAVRAGVLTRPRRGYYADASAPAEGIVAVASGGRLSCTSAARSFGLWGGTDPSLHVCVPPHSTRLPSADVVRHWIDTAPAEAWRVSLPDCLRTVVRCADEETAIAVLDTAIAGGMASLAMIRRMFESEPEWTREVAAKARPGSDSGVESIARQRLTAAGHVVEQQVQVAGVGRVDLRIDGCLFVEIDGFAFHGGRESFERDRARDAGLALRRERRLRLSARQVLNEWEVVRSLIETVLTTPEIGAESVPKREQLRRSGP